MKGRIYQKQNGALVDITPDAAPIFGMDGKADVDLANVNAAGQVAMAHAGKPSGSLVTLSITDNPTSGNNAFKVVSPAPADGFITFTFNISTHYDDYDYIHMRLADASTLAASSYLYYVHTFIAPKASHSNRGILVPISKGQYFHIQYRVGMAFGNMTAQFVYANGSAPA